MADELLADLRALVLPGVRSTVPQQQPQQQAGLRPFTLVPPPPRITGGPAGTITSLQSPQQSLTPSRIGTPTDSLATSFSRVPIAVTSPPLSGGLPVPQSSPQQGSLADPLEAASSPLPASCHSSNAAASCIGVSQRFSGSSPEGTPVATLPPATDAARSGAQSAPAPGGNCRQSTGSSGGGEGNPDGHIGSHCGSGSSNEGPEGGCSDRSDAGVPTGRSSDGFVDEEELYEMAELIQEKPRDVVHFIEEEGVVKLGEMEVQDSWVLKAFGGEAILTQGNEHADLDWRAMWRQRLSEGGRLSSTGWSTTVVVEAHVVNLLDAAAEGSDGLLRPLLRRYQAGGLPATVFALPAVQAVVQFKWRTWARSLLVSDVSSWGRPLALAAQTVLLAAHLCTPNPPGQVCELLLYLTWLVSFSVFTLLLVHFYTPEAPEPQPNHGGEAAAAPLGYSLATHYTGYSSVGPASSLAASAAVHRLLTLPLRTVAAARAASPPASGVGAATAGMPVAATVAGNAAQAGATAMTARLVELKVPSSVVETTALVLIFTCSLCLIPFMWMESATFRVNRYAWVSFWNLADLVSYLLQLTITMLFVHKLYVGEAWFSVMLAVQHVLLWGKLHYYLRVLNPARSLFLDTIRIVLMDLSSFIVFLAITMVGFAFAFYSLFRDDREPTDFTNLWHSICSMFAYLVQYFDTAPLWDSSHPNSAIIFFILYEFIFAILLLNLLIALMSSTFHRAREDEGVRFIVYRAEVIDELEGSLPSWLKRYMASSWFPRIVHVLRIGSAASYDVNLGSIWTGIGGVESTLMGAQLESRRRVEELERHVERMHGKLDLSMKLFFACGGGGGGPLHLPTAWAPVPLRHPAWSRPSGAAGQHGLDALSGEHSISDSDGGEPPAAVTGSRAAGKASGHLSVGSHRHIATQHHIATYPSGGHGGGSGGHSSASHHRHGHTPPPGSGSATRRASVVQRELAMRSVSRFSRDALGQVWDVEAATSSGSADSEAGSDDTGVAGDRVGGGGSGGQGHSGGASSSGHRLPGRRRGIRHGISGLWERTNAGNGAATAALAPPPSMTTHNEEDAPGTAVHRRTGNGGTAAGSSIPTYNPGQRLRLTRRCSMPSAPAADLEHRQRLPPSLGGEGQQQVQLHPGAQRSRSRRHSMVGHSASGSPGGQVLGTACWH